MRCFLFCATCPAFILIASILMIEVSMVLWISWIISWKTPSCNRFQGFLRFLRAISAMVRAFIIQRNFRATRYKAILRLVSEDSRDFVRWGLDDAREDAGDFRYHMADYVFFWLTDALRARTPLNTPVCVCVCVCVCVLSRRGTTGRRRTPFLPFQWLFPYNDVTVSQWAFRKELHSS